MNKQVNVITGKLNDFNLTAYLRSVEVDEDLDVMYPSGYCVQEVARMNEMLDAFMANDREQLYIVTQSPYVVTAMYDKVSAIHNFTTDIYNVSMVGKSFTATNMTESPEKLLPMFNLGRVEINL